MACRHPAKLVLQIINPERVARSAALVAVCSEYYWITMLRLGLAVSCMAAAVMQNAAMPSEVNDQNIVFLELISPREKLFNLCFNSVLGCCFVAQLL